MVGHEHVDRAEGREGLLDERRGRRGIGEIGLGVRQPFAGAAELLEQRRHAARVRPPGCPASWGDHE